MGRFIAIEGGDGSGKGTHTKLLVEHLTAEGFDVLETDFPRYDQDSSYYVRQYLNGAYGGPDDVPAELGSLPYALDRFAAKDEIISHLKKENSIVISNRYIASNLAHQGTKVLDATERKSFYERTMTTEYDILNIPRPDLNIVLVMPTVHMQANVDKKGTRGYTALKRDIHEADENHLDRAKANFQELCMLWPDEFTQINCVDEDKDMRSIILIQKDIQTLLKTV
jgi:dTMP kinase